MVVEVDGKTRDALIDLQLARRDKYSTDYIIVSGIVKSLFCALKSILEYCISIQKAEIQEYTIKSSIHQNESEIDLHYHEPPNKPPTNKTTKTLIKSSASASAFSTLPLTRYLYP